MDSPNNAMNAEPSTHGRLEKASSEAKANSQSLCSRVPSSTTLQWLSGSCKMAFFAFEAQI